MKKTILQHKKTNELFYIHGFSILKLMNQAEVNLNNFNSFDNIHDDYVIYIRTNTTS